MPATKRLPTSGTTLSTEVLPQLSEDYPQSRDWIRRYERLRRHPDLPQLLSKLSQFANPEDSGDDIRDFVLFSLDLPEYWEFIKSKNRRWVVRQTENLRDGTETFLAVLQDHSDLVQLYLTATPAEWNEARTEYDRLLATLISLRDQAAAGKHFLSKSDFPPLPLLPGHKRAREHFCIRALAWQAHRTFPPHVQSSKAAPTLRAVLLRKAGTEAAKRKLIPGKLTTAKEKIEKTYSASIAKGVGLHSAIAVLVSTSLNLRKHINRSYVSNLLRYDKPFPMPR